MEMDFGYVLTLGIFLLTGAVGYGILNRSVAQNTRDIARQDQKVSNMVTLETCSDHHRMMERTLQSHSRSIRGLENFSRWWLAVNGKSPDEITSILSGHNEV
jgi:hypothetical protein